MTDLPPPPEDAAAARALADSIVSTPEVAPTADDVREIMRAGNRRVLLLVIPLLVLGGTTVWFSAQGRAASQDSANATASGLADNARTDCITKRRNLQFDALGRISISANEAEVAGLVTDDEAEARRQLVLFAQAVADWTAATESLSAEVLDQEPPLGCGPPIVDVEDIPEDATPVNP